MENLLDLYCSYHPEFLKSLEVFSELNKKRILRILNNEKDKMNFLSTIAEIQFGLLFVKLGLEIEYDKKYPNNQKPDWSILVLDSNILAEVYRLGKSKKDQARSDFEYPLMKKIEKLSHRYLIKMTFLDEYFDTAKFNPQIIVNELDTWLTNASRNKGETIILQDNFLFEIRKTITPKNHLYCIGNVSSIEIKQEKLEQIEKLNPNEISKKLTKYISLISENHLPHILCISIDFISGFDFDDFTQYFLGKGVENIDFGTPLGNREEFKQWGQTWTELGEFYNNPTLSGLILLYNNKFRFIPNPNRNQIIYDKKYKRILDKFMRYANTD